MELVDNLMERQCYSIERRRSISRSFSPKEKKERKKSIVMSGS